MHTKSRASHLRGDGHYSVSRGDTVNGLTRGAMDEQIGGTDSETRRSTGSETLAFRGTVPYNFTL